MLVWRGHRTKVRSVAFSPDGRRLASAAERTVGVKLWDPTSGAAAGELKGGRGHAAGVAFGPDGARVATVSSYLTIWDAHALRPLSMGYGPQCYHGPAFAPGGAAVAATGWDQVSVWDAPATPRPDTLAAGRANWGPDVVLHAPGAYTRFTSVAFDPTGARVAANGLNRAVVWDRATGAVRHSFPHPKSDVLSAVAFAPDGETLAYSQGKAAVLQPLDGAEQVVLAGHALFVRAIGFTPDGRTVMTAASDGTVRFWDAASGAPGRVFDWGIGRVYSAAFAPGGLTCAAGGEDGRLVVWDVDA